MTVNTHPKSEHKRSQNTLTRRHTRLLILGAAHGTYAYMQLPVFSVLLSHLSRPNFPNASLCISPGLTRDTHAQTPKYICVLCKLGKHVSKNTTDVGRFLKPFGSTRLLWEPSMVHKHTRSSLSFCVSSHLSRPNFPNASFCLIHHDCAKTPGLTRDTHTTTPMQMCRYACYANWANTSMLTLQT